MAFGAQLDQAHTRAGQHGAEPHAMRFYSGSTEPDPETGHHTPRSRLVTSARNNKVSMSAQVMGNAITSPKSTFERTLKTGERVYPNDEMANSAIANMRAGRHYTEARASATGGMHGNVRRAQFAVEQHLRGVPNAEIRNPGGSAVFGPKTGPYHNAWVDPHGSSQFLVSDVHTGGGGFAPHLSHEAPQRLDAEGTPMVKTQRLKSGATREVKVYGTSPREKYLGIKGIHAFHDHIARSELAKRGLQSLSGAQAAQWGEERIRRGLTSETEAFPGSHQASVHTLGQGSLFDEVQPAAQPRRRTRRSA